MKIKEFFFFLRAKKWVLPTVLAIFAAGAALSAVQLLTGIEAARESVRAGGVPFSFAAMFSFPPENFLTLLAPYLFGDLINNPYWGRAYLWEMNLFIGLNGLILAGYGLLSGGRTARILAVAITVIFILALGVHTPLFRILYDFLPGFDKFRGVSKFVFFAALLLIILAGTGLDKLISDTRKNAIAPMPPALPVKAAAETPTDPSTDPVTHSATDSPAQTSPRSPSGDGTEQTPLNLRKYSLVARIIPKTYPERDGSVRTLRINLPASSRGYVFILAAALLTAAGALWLNLIATGSLSPELWTNFLALIARTGESYLDARLFAHREFILHNSFFASQWLLIAALTLAVTAWFWRLTRKQPKIAVYGIFLLTLVEVFLFARMTRESFNPAMLTVPALKEFARSIKNDERILNLWQPNSALSLGAHDIWGHDPGVLWRYAQFIGFTQGYNPERVTNYINFKDNHRLLKMLRLRFILVPERHKIKIMENRELLPRLNLIENWEVIRERAAVLKRMGEESFDPARTVILEKEPELGDSGGTGTRAKKLTWETSRAGNCRIIEESTDHITILAQLPRDAILLITDTYSQGWRIKPLHESGQRRYEILPGDYTLVAVPLKRGEHQLRLEYSPWGYCVGKWITAFALLSYILALIYFFRERVKASKLTNHDF